MMNLIHSGIIQLLKSAVLGQSLPLPAGFSLDEAFPRIKAHQLIPIAYDGAVRCGIDPKTPIMRRMLQGYIHCSLISEGQMMVLEQIYQEFEHNGIDYMPVKGCNLKAMFPKPEMRQMGDADILIRVEQYEKIKPILAGLGLKEDSESDHELVWLSDRLHLELHKRLFPSAHTDFGVYFGDGWCLAKNAGGFRYHMTCEDEFAYLFTHYAKHYRAGGIGCRHILDLWVYRRAHPDLDEKRICKIMERIRLREFYENTNDLIRLWFEDGDGSEKTEFMSEYIFNSGSWGNMEKRMLAIYARNASPASQSRAKTRLQIVFPPVSKLRYSYPILKKMPWLTPVFWPVRWADILLFKRGSIQVKLSAMKAATVEQVDNFHQSLRYVGIDFHHE